MSAKRDWETSSVYSDRRSVMSNSMDQSYFEGQSRAERIEEEGNDEEFRNLKEKLEKLGEKMAMKSDMRVIEQGLKRMVERLFQDWKSSMEAKFKSPPQQCSDTKSKGSPINITRIISEIEKRQGSKEKSSAADVKSKVSCEIKSMKSWVKDELKSFKDEHSRLHAERTPESKGEGKLKREAELVSEKRGKKGSEGWLQESVKESEAKLKELIARTENLVKDISKRSDKAIKEVASSNEAQIKTLTSKYDAQFKEIAKANEQVKKSGKKSQAKEDDEILGKLNNAEKKLKDITGKIEKQLNNELENIKKRLDKHESQLETTLNDNKKLREAMSKSEKHMEELTHKKDKSPTTKGSPKKPTKQTHDIADKRLNEHETSLKELNSAVEEFRRKLEKNEEQLKLAAKESEEKLRQVLSEQEAAREDLNSLRAIGEENMKALEEALIKFSSANKDKELFNEQLKDNELQLREVAQNVEKVKVTLKENKKQTKEKLDKLQETIAEGENQLIEHIETMNERISKNAEDLRSLVRESVGSVRERTSRLEKSSKKLIEDVQGSVNELRAEVEESKSALMDRVQGFDSEIKERASKISKHTDEEMAGIEGLANNLRRLEGVVNMLDNNMKEHQAQMDHELRSQVATTKDQMKELLTQVNKDVRDVQRQIADSGNEIVKLADEVKTQSKAHSRILEEKLNTHDQKAKDELEEVRRRLSERTAKLCEEIAKMNEQVRNCENAQREATDTKQLLTDFIEEMNSTLTNHDEAMHELREKNNETAEAFEKEVKGIAAESANKFEQLAAAIEGLKSTLNNMKPEVPGEIEAAIKELFSNEAELKEQVEKCKDSINGKVLLKEIEGVKCEVENIIEELTVNNGKLEKVKSEVLNLGGRAAEAEVEIKILKDIPSQLELVKEQNANSLNDAREEFDKRLDKYINELKEDITLLKDKVEENKEQQRVDYRSLNDRIDLQERKNLEAASAKRTEAAKKQIDNEELEHIKGKLAAYESALKFDEKRMEEINNKVDSKLKELLKNNEAQVKEIETLSTRLENNENQAETDMQSLNAKLEDIEGKLQEVAKADDSKNISDKVQSIKAELKENAKRTDHLGNKLEAIEEQINIELSDKQKQSKTDIANLKNELETHTRYVDAKLDNYAKEYKNCLNSNEAQMKNAIKDMSSKLSNTKEKLTDKVGADIDNLKDELGEIEKQLLDNIKEVKSALKENNSSHKNAIETLSTRVENYEEAIEADIEDMRAKVEDSETKTNALEEAQDKLEETISQIKKDAEAIVSKLNEYPHQLATKSAEINSEVKKSIAQLEDKIKSLTAFNEGKLRDSEEQVRELVAELQRKIDSDAEKASNSLAEMREKVARVEKPSVEQLNSNKPFIDFIKGIIKEEADTDHLNINYEELKSKFKEVESKLSKLKEENKMSTGITKQSEDSSRVQNPQLLINQASESLIQIKNTIMDKLSDLASKIEQHNKALLAKISMQLPKLTTDHLRSEYAKRRRTLKGRSKKFWKLDLEFGARNPVHQRHQKKLSTLLEGDRSLGRCDEDKLSRSLVLDSNPYEDEAVSEVLELSHDSPEEDKSWMLFLRDSTVQKPNSKVSEETVKRKVSELHSFSFDLFKVPEGEAKEQKDAALSANNFCNDNSEQNILDA